MSKWSRALASMGLVWAVAFGGGCGKKDLPPSLPRTQIYQRFAPRVDLVELVISDRKRAEKVRALYIEIEEIFREEAIRAAKGLQELGSEKGKATSEEELREGFARFREYEKEAYAKYIDVQMKIRDATTPEEFARLNALR